MIDLTGKRFGRLIVISMCDERRIKRLPSKMALQAAKKANAENEKK